MPSNLRVLSSLNSSDRKGSLFAPKRTKKARWIIAPSLAISLCVTSTVALASYGNNKYDMHPGKITGDKVKSGRISWFGQYGYGKYKDGKNRNVWRDSGDNGRNASGLPQTHPGKITGDKVKSGRISWFGQYGYGKYKDGKNRNVWRDSGDNGRNASGLPQTHPGIAIYNRKTLGHWWEVELAGKTYRVKQVDIGPHPRTGRQVDINAPLADMAGYTPSNFPTNRTIRYRYLGKNPTWQDPKVKLAKLTLLTLPKRTIVDTPPLSVIEHAKKTETNDIKNAKDLKANVIGGYPHGLHPVIKASMIEASKYLPAGHKVRFLNAARHNSTVSNSYHLKHDHKGALAVDIEIVDPRGNSLRNIRSPKNFAIYRDFMHWTKKVQYDLYPAYRGKGRWGGYFVSGVSQDLMHYDLGPEKGTAAGDWERGLKPAYRHFGRPNDVGRGMGNIAKFLLPFPGLGNPGLNILGAAPDHNANTVRDRTPRMKTATLRTKMKPAKVKQRHRARDYDEDDDD